MKKNKYNVAVVGATGNVGRELLQTLKERNFPIDNVYALASRRSVGREVSFGEEERIKVKNLENFDFAQADIGLFSAGSNVSAQYGVKASEQGCIVIDNTSYFRMDKDVPLIVPEVNLNALADYKKRNIIANPNCSTIQMVVALAPLHKLAKIKRVVVSTYQSVSGAGKIAMDELFEQSKSSFMYNKKEPVVFTKQIAFNVIPHIDVFMEDGFTKEEWKMKVETKKIMEDDNIEVSATCVRTPIFIGHAEAIHIEFEEEFDLKAVYKSLEEAKGIKLVDKREDGGYITPVEIVGSGLTYVSRVRRDVTVKNGLALWVVADNVKKGAALNTVQIAEALIQDYI